MLHKKGWKAVSVIMVLAIAALFSALVFECSSKSNSVTGPQSNKVTIQNMTFSPPSITVSVGDVVTWTNLDQTPHTVSSGTPASPTTTFDSGIMAQNVTFSHTFDTKGTYLYYCKVHPTTMTGMVVVQ